MARLLVVHHSPTETVRALTDAVVAGANDDEIEGVEVVVRPALEANAGDVLGADGYLLGTTANFGYMSGALKHFFDTIFLQAGGALSDDGSAAAAGGGKKPFGLWVHGRYDTTGAVRSVLSIVGELRNTLNTEEGSSLAEELDRLYDYMMGRLLDITTKRDMSGLDEVQRLLITVREGWVQVSAATAGAASPPRS